MPGRPATRDAQFGMRGVILLTSVVLGVIFLSGGVLASRLFAQEAVNQEEAGETGTSETGTGETASNSGLADRQRLLSTNFEELEKLMLKMADIDESNNPQRANLLREAVRNSRNLRVHSRMVETTDSLGGGQLKRATDQQTLIENDLRNLLRLLQSENRDEQLKNEEERIRSYIKSAQKLLNRQRSIKGRTSGGAETQPLSEEQARLADDAQSLADEIAEQEEGGRSENAEGASSDAKSADGESSEESQEGEAGEGKDGESAEGKSQEGEPQDGDSDEGSPQEGDSAEGDAKPGEMQEKEGKGESGESPNGKPSGEGESSEGKMEEGKGSDQEGKQGESDSDKPMGEPSEEGQEGESPKGQEGSQDQQGEPQEGQPSEKGQKAQKGQQGQESQKGQQGQQGQQGEQGEQQEGQQQAQNQQQQQQQEFSPRRRIEEAQRRMEEAQKKLDEAKQEDAVEAQEAAQDELAQAIAELEEILRQIREEEIERVLARLEARFTKMLEMQLRVNDDTERLAKIPADQRGSAEDAEAGKLSFAEKQIIVEADKALELLKEEGSSIAFPESLMQIREDMQEVSNRLGQTKLDDLTMAIEEDIVMGLEELLESLKQAQREQEERQNQQQQQQQQQQSQPGEEPLVDQIAELRLIKSMQVRVNQRTDLYARMLDDSEDEVGQATTDDLKAQLRDLARRQNRIYDITRDNVQGKNQ